MCDLVTIVCAMITINNSIQDKVEPIKLTNHTDKKDQIVRTESEKTFEDITIEKMENSTKTNQ